MEYRMSKVRVASFGVSIDGFAAGPHQDLENPLGVRGLELMEWFFHTKIWRTMHGMSDEGDAVTDNAIAARGFENIDAWILGRNMFGPIRGPWPNDDWKG
jgi:dihydrofolate reductase